MNDLRLELRSRNNVLWHAIFDTCPSVSEFSRKHKLDKSRVGALLNLSQSPFTKQGGFRWYVKRLIEVTGIGGDELFPAHLYKNAIPSMVVAEVDGRRFIGLAAAKRLALPPTQDDGILSDERRSMLANALRTLTPNERKVIEMSFGFNDNDEPDQTLAAVGQQIGRSKETIRQIRAKALRKLRHPSMRLWQLVV